MSFSKLANRIGDKIAIPQLANILVYGSALFYLLAMMRPGILDRISFVPYLVLKGEIWRVVTFLFYPLDAGPIFAIFAYMFFLMIAKAMEHEWGDGKFTLYILISTLSTIILSFLLPFHVGTNAYIYTSLFLAFAYVYPEFVVYIFFILPVRMKYLAAVTWVFFGWTIIMGDWIDRFYAIIPLLNFFLFFGKSIYQDFRVRKGRMEQSVQQIQEKSKAFHLCVICQATEKSHPQKSFRACSECKGGPEYCDEHLAGHQHIV